MVITRKVALALTGFALSLGAEASLADVVPVVSAENPLTSIRQYELVDIYLGKIRQFPNGNTVTPIDQTEGSPARAKFYSEFAGKSASQIKAYWAKMIFTGRGRPPAAAENGEEVKQRLANNPNAIGYIDRSLVDTSVKILQVQ